FQIEEGAVFQFDKISGTINPESELLITYIDILGTCFNDKRRPVTLSAQNLEAYKKRIENGLFFLSPENLDEVMYFYF
ncbi:hypothetical protein PIROE2DRAFT_16982, partial [Piromyces sp. E2]